MYNIAQEIKACHTRITDVIEVCEELATDVDQIEEEETTVYFFDDNSFMMVTNNTCKACTLSDNLKDKS